MCVTVPNFLTIGQTVSEIGRFSDFQDGGRSPYWISKIRNFTVDMLEMANMRHQTKFRGDPSNRCQDTAI